MYKNILFLVVFLVMLSSCNTMNKITRKEKREGWVALFNGKDFSGWRQVNGSKMPANWTIEDHAMKVFTAEGKKPGWGNGGDIIFADKQFRNYELSIDWKTSKAGNSGIFYNVREEPGQPIYYAALEAQVLDNRDASDNVIASHLAGSLYDMLAADPATVKPAGEWNNLVIKVENGNVTHTQNGVPVVSYQLWTPEWDIMVKKSKFKNFPGFKKGISKEGYIGLQDHGYPVWFRNIKIREL
ncbi:DUF1080 domain-containing protein [Haoranjiania flava]|uniref:DUF1080 domain-containing protein n=1 Tax=Haoranjiania flava TaxID=1856322 RepID=A0AAE3IQC8_9BACT|nr:DUF1080 domain-containing protein [Haoranjiania flava]MCU7695153.1 DUF1080 domain-containing protein [Haoranjiania flava]